MYRICPLLVVNDQLSCAGLAPPSRYQTARHCAAAAGYGGSRCFGRAWAGVHDCHRKDLGSGKHVHWDLEVEGLGETQSRYRRGQ